MGLISVIIEPVPTKDELRAAEVMAERELASALREAVERSGLDRQEIARRLGVHRSNVSKILNNPRNLTVHMAARLLRAAGQRLLFNAIPVASKGQCQADHFVALGVPVIAPKVNSSTSSEWLVGVRPTTKPDNNPEWQRTPEKIAV